MKVQSSATGLAILLMTAASVSAATTLRIMPPDGATLAAGQRFDLRVEAASDDGRRPEGLRVFVNGRDVTSRSDPRAGDGAPDSAAAFLMRGFSLDVAGAVIVRAETADGAKAESRLRVDAWTRARAGVPRARNIIVLLGDGMGIAHRTAARIVSRGVQNGKAAGRLAMDTLDVTGLVMTASLNSVITDSSPGMSAYVTGQKSNNNQEGVFPDNTLDAFDNPRIEYLGELLRRTRGAGFHVGIVTTADVTDSTPAANAVHSSDRSAGPGIAVRFFDERARNGVTVLLGGGFEALRADISRWDTRRRSQPPRGVRGGRLHAGRDRHRSQGAARGKDCAALTARALSPVAFAGGVRQDRRRQIQR